MKYDKAAKEAWVSGLTGSSLTDINSVSLALPLSVLLWSALQSRMRTFTPYTPVAFLIDFLINCGIILGALSIYADSIWLLNLLSVLPAAFVFLSSKPSHARSRPSRPPPKDTTNLTPPDRLPVKPFITHYRGSMIVTTCIAILAVDFQVFPRRFAKVENWGTSLMDIGVGSFVFTAGVVSIRSSLKAQPDSRPSFLKRILDSFRHSLPLLVLGIIRLLSVKGLDYAEHVTEYGVHWNFFFTLGLLPPFVALFQSAFDYIPSYAVLSFVLAAAYEFALDKTDLGGYILTAPRVDLLSKNREGIFSFCGYLAIFLAGQSVGSAALPREVLQSKDTSCLATIRHSVLGKLAISATVWTGLFYVSISYYGLGLSVSRRLANLPYFLWVASYNSTQIALCCAIESVCFPNLYKSLSKEEESRRTREATSSVLFAINRNGLSVFLIANLLTGVINLTVPTLQMGVIQSMGILLGYVITFTAVAVGLDKLNLSIKL